MLKIEKLEVGGLEVGKLEVGGLEVGDQGQMCQFKDVMPFLGAEMNDVNV